MTGHERQAPFYGHLLEYIRDPENNMPVRTVCACGAEYTLKDQYAGMRLGCPKCGGPVAVPALPPRPPVKEQEGDQAFAHDVFLLNQDHLAVNEVYHVTGKDTKPLMFAERPVYVLMNILAAAGGILAGIANVILAGTLYSMAKKAGLPLPALMALGLWSKLGTVVVVAAVTMFLVRKRNITVYRDDTRAKVLLRVTQDFRVPLLTSSYTVTDQDGRPLGRFMKKRPRNIFRKRWYGFGPDGKLVLVAREDSMVLSALRRAMFGFFGFLHTDFVIYGLNGVLGEFNRRMTLQDRYVLDLGADPLRSLDRRLAVALGVLLDTGEGR